jgi:hypothetical protein
MAKTPRKSNRPKGKGKTDVAPRRAVKAVKRVAAHGRTPEPPTLAEVKARLNAKPGFLASLTPEQRAAFADYDGPEVSGGPGPVIQRVKRATS